MSITDAKPHRLTEPFAKAVLKDTFIDIRKVQHTDNSWTLPSMDLTANSVGYN